MEESKKNAGFSLVELVIVIAIMAVLITVLAPMYLKYVERSKVTTDQQIASAVHEAISVAIADENIEERPLSGFSPNAEVKLEGIGIDTDKPYTEFVKSIKVFLQVDDLGDIKKGLKSREYKGQDILVKIDELTQNVIITIPSKSGNVKEDLIIK